MSATASYLDRLGELMQANVKLRSWLLMQGVTSPDFADDGAPGLLPGETADAAWERKLAGHAERLHRLREWVAARGIALPQHLREKKP